MIVRQSQQNHTTILGSYLVLFDGDWLGGFQPAFVVPHVALSNPLYKTVVKCAHTWFDSRDA